MKELADLVRTWRELPTDAEAVLATVVGTSGSTYRKVGARMLLADGKWICGSLSGGCLEADVLQTAWSRTEDGPSLVTYDTTADDDIVWGFGLGCNGVVQVLLERVDGSSPVMRILADCVEKRQAAVLMTCISAGPAFGTHRLAEPAGPERLAINAKRRSFIEEQGGSNYLFEPIFPPRKLYLFGAGHDAVSLAHIASEVGFRVSVVDRRDEALIAERFPLAEFIGSVEDLSIETGSALVIMSHHYLNDLAYLRLALSSQASYVGLLGPGRRRDKLFNELRASGFEFTSEMEAKLFSPIGLDLGAEGPEQIALAILGEILAVERGRTGASLKGSSSPLHSDQGSLISGSKPEDPACGLSV